MEYLPNGYSLDIPQNCFPLSTDSMLLAHFAGRLGNKNVLDLGSGSGTLGLLLCAGNPNCRVTGIEQDEQAHEAALRNIQSNRIEDRMESQCMDLRQISGRYPAGSFACCISNPPYFSGGPAAALQRERREDTCTAADLFKAVGWALKYGGDFYLVHRPERLGELIILGAANGMEAKRLGLVRHTEGAEISLVLLQFRKGGKPGLKTEDWILHDREGHTTPLYRKIYHIQED